jgi:superfamily II DNA/RNA helicase
MTFSDLGLSVELEQTVNQLGYTLPTPIQEQAIPQILRGRDIFGCAQTGTGKTASFILPMIEILNGSRAKVGMPRSIVLEPTRELAAQVLENFLMYGKNHKLKAALLVGGESMTDQEKQLKRGVDVLIATPGRLLDLFERGQILLADVKILVIDESDRMLDMGFIPDIDRIIAKLPKIRQTLLFSATMPAEIQKLAENYLINPKEIIIAPSVRTASTVTQYVVRVPSAKKRDALRHFLRAQKGTEPTIIFCNRKRDISILVSSLKKYGFNAGGFHGDMAQSQRNQTLDDFKQGKVTVLVASNVAARGLDVEGLSLVVNFDVPLNAEDYVHRIGRTGRAGKEGLAITLVSDHDEKFLKEVHTFIKEEIPLLVWEEISPEIVRSVEPENKLSESTPPRNRRRRNKGTAAETPMANPVKPHESIQDQDDDKDDNKESDKQSSLPEKKSHSVSRDRARENRPPSSDDKLIGFGGNVPAFMLRSIISTNQS